MQKVKHLRTADCAVAGYREHKDGGSRLAAARALRRRRRAAPRRRGEQLQRRAAQAAHRRARAVSRSARSTAIPGRTGPKAMPEAAASGQRDAGRSEPVERGQGPELGAVARRARRRGRLRAPPGRPLPAHGPLPALAPRPRARRPARTSNSRLRYRSSCGRSSAFDGARPTSGSCSPTRASFPSSLSSPDRPTSSAQRFLSWNWRPRRSRRHCSPRPPWRGNEAVRARACGDVGHAPRRCRLSQRTTRARRMAHPRARASRRCHASGPRPTVGSAPTRTTRGTKNVCSPCSAVRRIPKSSARQSRAGRLPSSKRRSSLPTAARQWCVNRRSGARTHKDESSTKRPSLP